LRKASFKDVTPVRGGILAVSLVAEMAGGACHSAPPAVLAPPIPAWIPSQRETGDTPRYPPENNLYPISYWLRLRKASCKDVTPVRDGILAVSLVAEMAGEGPVTARPLPSSLHPSPRGDPFRCGRQETRRATQAFMPEHESC